MTMNNPYQQYKQQSVMSMTPGEMLTTLYDGAIKEIELAKTAFAKNDLTEINTHLQKVQAIFRHLRSTLDFNIEISKNLDSLYDYFITTAINANIKKDSSELENLIQLITELRDTYIQADRIARSTEAAI